MEQVTVSNTELKADPGRPWLTGAGILLAALAAGLVLTAALSGGINFALWFYLMDVTSLRGDTWEFVTYAGSINVAAMTGAVAGVIGAFIGRRIGRQRGTAGRSTLMGFTVGTLLATVANIVLFFLSVYPGS